MSRTVRSTAQFTMFDESAAQADMFAPGKADDAAPAPAVSKGPPRTREEHHAAMLETLAFLSGCETNPWDAFHVQYESFNFRARAEWFPADVSAPLLTAFADHAERLDFANARPADENWDDGQ